MITTIATRDVNTIGDLLALCDEHGIQWHHPEWGDGVVRVCQARIVLPNKWEISLGCCDAHYCSWRDLHSYSIDVYGTSKPAAEWFSSPDAEIAIFRPDGSWYIPEEADAHPDDNTWVGGWWHAERILAVLIYIGGMT
jgi:hypothetical protein